MTAYADRVRAKARRCPRCGDPLTHHDADVLFRDYLACERCAGLAYDPASGEVLGDLT